MADLWLAFVVTSIVFGFFGYVYALKYGRNPVRWAALGVVFNILILAFMIIAGGRSPKARQYIR